MADIAVNITDPQLRALRRLDQTKTARQVLQAHVDTWLAPYVAELGEVDKRAVMEKYLAASPAIREQVETLLGL
jgi:hypothetical protein